MTDPRPRLTKLILLANLIVGIPALLVYAEPNLVVLGYFLLILPGLILSALPTLAAYLLLFTLCWLACYRLPMSIATLLGFAFLWLVGVQLPWVWNDRTEQALKQAQARNREAASPLAIYRTVSLELPAHRATDGCPDLCLLLLYNGEAERVLLPPPAGPAPGRRKARRTTIAYRLETRDICPNNPRETNRQGHSVFLAGEMAKQVRSIALMRMATGVCLLREELPDTPSEFAIRLVDDPIGSRRSWHWGPPPIRNQGVELLLNGKVVAAELSQSTARLNTPLHFIPVGGMPMSGWTLSQQRLDPPRQPPLDFLATQTSYEWRLPTGASTAELRQQLDRFLASTAASESDAAASLVSLFIEDIEKQGPQRGDALRVAKLIEDERFTYWGGLNSLARRYPDLQASLWSALLNRLSRPQPERQAPYEQLERLAEALPADLFQKPNPQWDALLANPAKRTHLNFLVLRLVERGPGAASQLVSLLAEPDRSKAANGAIRALCALGPMAKEHLPAVRSLVAQDKVSAHLLRWQTWKAMLVALGAPLTEFPEKERDSLARQARDRCGYPTERAPRRNPGPEA